MTKEEFKEIFAECFDINLKVEYTPNCYHSSEYSLKVAIVDKETKEEVFKSLVNLGEIR